MTKAELRKIFEAWVREEAEIIDVMLALGKYLRNEK